MDCFVTGTDTACGKTVVTAAIALACAPDVVVRKPVQTGSPPDDDAAWVGAVAGCPAAVGMQFREPLAPAVCAVREGRPIPVDDLVADARALAAAHRVCEAAGGLLAPLTDDVTMADLAARISWPLVIAARPGLGTLNHTALTIEACLHRGLPLYGVVVSGYRGGVTEETNLQRLADMSPHAPLLGVVDAVDGLDDLPPADAAAALRAASHWEVPPTQWVVPTAGR